MGGKVMKKIIFLLLLAQTISCLFADTGCYKHNWQWGVKGKEQVKCYCNCEKYNQAGNKCTECGHTRIPKKIVTR